MLKTIFVAVSDTHIGGMTALMPEYWVTDEKQQVFSSPAQKWLYANWLDFWEYVTKLAGVTNGGRRSKHRLVVAHLGDIVDGNHHQTVQALPNLIDQENMASHLLTKVSNLCKGELYILRGTEAHAGEAAQSEVRIAQSVGAKAVEWAMKLELDGVRIDLGHHGRSSQRDWTSAAAGVAAQVSTSYISRGEMPPDLILRGHCHIIDDTGIKLPYTRAIMLPAWQLKTAYAYKVAGNNVRSDIGGLIFTIEEGRAVLDDSRARYKAAPGQQRTIKIGE